MLERLCLHQRFTHQPADDLLQKSPAPLGTALRVNIKSELPFSQLDSAKHDGAVIQRRSQALRRSSDIRCARLAIRLPSPQPIPEMIIFLAQFWKLAQC